MMTLLEQLRDIRQQPQGSSYVSLQELCVKAADTLERYETTMKALANDPAVPPFVRTLAAGTIHGESTTTDLKE